jgi:hypothetical protein
VSVINTFKHDSVNRHSVTSLSGGTKIVKAIRFLGSSAAMMGSAHRNVNNYFLIIFNNENGPVSACFTATIYVYNRHARKIRLLTLQDFSAGMVFALWEGVEPLQHVFRNTLVQVFGTSDVIGPVDRPNKLSLTQISEVDGSEAVPADRERAFVLSDRRSRG